MTILTEDNDKKKDEGKSKLIEEVEEVIPEPKPEYESVPEPEPEVVEEKVEEKAPLSNDDMVAILAERASCTHEFKDLKLGYKETTKGKRIQPFCTKTFSDGSKCTYRGRFVGAQKVKEGGYEDTPTPWTMQDIIDHTVGKMLDLFGIEHTLFQRWSGIAKQDDNLSTY